MTKLVVDELRTTLSQEITYSLNKRVSIAAISIYVYMHNSPSGTFTLSVKSGATTVASQDFTATELKTNLSTSDDYLYMWKPIQFDDAIQLEKGVYTLELSSSGYTYSSSSWIGWIKEHENLFIPSYGDLDNFSMYPLSYRIYQYRRT